MTEKYKHDLLFTLKLAGMAILAVSILLFAGGFLFGGFTLRSAVSIWRSGSCIVSAILLFLVAGMFLFKKTGADIDPLSAWRKTFHQFKYSTVFLIITLAFILTASVADWILFQMPA